jgi:hypothetical protein
MVAALVSGCAGPPPVDHNPSFIGSARGMFGIRALASKEQLRGECLNEAIRLNDGSLEWNEGSGQCLAVPPAEAAARKAAFMAAWSKDAEAQQAQRERFEREHPLTAECVRRNGWRQTYSGEAMWACISMTGGR